jgi:DNA primase
MYFINNPIDRLLVHADIVTVARHLGIELRQVGNKKKRGYVGLCPFHRGKHPSFKVFGNRQMYYCFGCGASGNAITLVREKEFLNFADAVVRLTEITDFRIPSGKTKVTKARRRVRRPSTKNVKPIIRKVEVEAQHVREHDDDIPF